MKKYYIILIILTLGLLGIAITSAMNRDDTSEVILSQNEDSSSAAETSDNKTIETETEDDKSTEELPIIINKQNPLPENYPINLVVPNVRLRLSSSEEQMQIDQAVEPDLIELFEAAKSDGINLVFGSGYRSYAKQKQFYDSYVARDGISAADTYSARPGHSEHQSGLSFDATSPSGACHLEICWENTAEGLWMADNAHRYGFILRYPEGKSGITGYQYEPWHFRYVGKETASRIYNSSTTLEEYLGLPAAPTY